MRERGSTRATRRTAAPRFAFAFGVCLLALCATAMLGAGGATADAGEAIDLVGPEPLSFDELVALSDTGAPAGELGDRVMRLLSEPFVTSAAEARGSRARRPEVDGLGPVLRAALWNLDHATAFEWIRLAFSDPAAFTAEASPERPATADWMPVEADLRVLQDVDLLILNEVDLGMAESGYRDIARELADGLDMNFAYGVEFIEVDPRRLGVGALDAGDPLSTLAAPGGVVVDARAYRGLHGSAILSRYPIRRARIHRLPVCHDWYDGELNGIAAFERGRRWTAGAVFQARIPREVRHGGRMALLADILVPELPTGAVTVVATQLENKTTVACRRRQMEDLLRVLRDTPHPVVLAGDLNTTGVDSTPTSVRREIVKYVARVETWARRVLQWFTPVAAPAYLTAPLNHVKNLRDPTAVHIPLFATNAERRLFDRVRDFRFADGGAFDFRGDRERTLTGKAGTLANSNARAGKGFETTFSFPREYPGLAGSYKLDWFFVKPVSGREGQRYRFAPHFPRTMDELNNVVPGGISDHHPITVDLPLHEPAAGATSP